MSRIFISHATNDAAHSAGQLVEELESAGRPCWVGPRDVKPALPYPGQIVRAIRDSCGLVLLLTPGANESTDVLQEVQRASREKKSIAPVVINGTLPTDDLGYFVDVRHQIGWTSAAAVAKALMGVFSAPEAMFLVPAVEPQALTVPPNHLVFARRSGSQRGEAELKIRMHLKLFKVATLASAAEVTGLTHDEVRVLLSGMVARGELTAVEGRDAKTEVHYRMRGH